MFRNVFKNDATLSISGHQALTFNTGWTKAKVTAQIRKRGIAGFLEKDNKGVGYGITPYKDDRVIGTVNVQHMASCCSFTKDPEKWYLFPIHASELAVVGLEEDDLIRWIKTLNGMKVGFKYLYFGAQEGGSWTDKWFKGEKHNGISPISKERYSSATLFWVAVPKLNSRGKNGIVTNINPKIPYMHWIYLRYLINYQTSSGNSVPINIPKLSYYNIPRVMMTLIDEHKLPAFKAFMYTMVAAPWYSGWGICYSDYGGNTPTEDNNKNAYPNYTMYYPYLGVTAAQFKALMHGPTSNGTMNATLCSQNTSNVVKELKLDLTALHSPNKCFEYIKQGDLKGFIAYLDSLYHPKKAKAKSNGKKSKTKVTSDW